MEKNNLAEIIKEAREKLKISQRELSRRTGIDNNTISQIEKGERKKPNSLSLIKLSQALDLNLDALMDASGYSFDDIRMTYEANPNLELAQERLMDLKGMYQDTLDKIDKIEKSIENIRHSMKTHSDPAYATMTEKDIEFFDEQSLQLIDVNQTMLQIYSHQAKQLKILLDESKKYTNRKKD